MTATTADNNGARRPARPGWHGLAIKLGLTLLRWARRRPARIDREEQIRMHLVREQAQRREDELARLTTRPY